MKKDNNENILVVVDMQNDFLDGSLANERGKKIVGLLIDHIKTLNYDKVFFTQDTHFDNYLSTLEGKNLPIPHCIKDTKGWKINEKLYKFIKAKNINFEVVEKNTFGSIDLALKLKEYTNNNRNAKIYFCGVCTGICVVNCALITKNICNEVPIYVIKDFCSCVSKESHDAALKTMKTSQINII